VTRRTSKQPNDGGVACARPITPARAFGERVALLRGEAGLAEAELATRSGLRSVTKIERGLWEPRLHEILGLCKGLGISPNVLLRGMYGKRA
jgi:transcriptional regulator with XRE-family HTH domain